MGFFRSTVKWTNLCNHEVADDEASPFAEHDLSCVRDVHLGVQNESATAFTRAEEREKTNDVGAARKREQSQYGVEAQRQRTGTHYLILKST